MDPQAWSGGGKTPVCLEFRRLASSAGAKPERARGLGLKVDDGDF